MAHFVDQKTNVTTHLDKSSLKLGVLKKKSDLRLTERLVADTLFFSLKENTGLVFCRAHITLQKEKFIMFCPIKPNLTFIFIASEAHWLCWVDGVEGAAPVAAVTSSDTTSAPLHARRATVKRVAGSHAVVVVAIDEVVAPPIPTICRGRKG